MPNKARNGRNIRIGANLNMQGKSKQRPVNFSIQLKSYNFMIAQNLFHKDQLGHKKN